MEKSAAEKGSLRPDAFVQLFFRPPYSCLPLLLSAYSSVCSSPALRSLPTALYC